MERLTKGIWIPIEIWEDKNLTWNEKILFLEIDSFTSRNTDCFFSNEYIANLLGITENSANRVLSSLIQKGYVTKTKFDGRRRFVKTAFSYNNADYSQMNNQPTQTSVSSPISSEYIYKQNNNTYNKLEQTEVCMSENNSDREYKDKINFDALVDFFNNTTNGVFGVVRKPLSDKRKKLIRARINEHGKQAFIDAINKACASDFLKGQNNNEWTATFDWIIKPTNFEKIISGNYDNKRNRANQNTTSGIDEELLRSVANGYARGMYELEQKQANK